MTDYKTQNYQIAGVTTITTTGTINNLDIKGYSTLVMGNAAEATITGIRAGYDGQEITIIAGTTSTVFFAHDSASSSAANRLINFIASGATPISSGAVTYRYQSASARWLLVSHEQGREISIPYSAGDFTATTGTWTVDLGDIRTWTYFIEGNEITVVIEIDSTSVSATPNDLVAALPNGYTNAFWSRNPCQVVDAGGAGALGIGRMQASSGSIFIQSGLTGTGWSVATNSTNVRGTFIGYLS